VAAWIDVYCRRADVQLDPDDLFRAVDEADLMTLAEVLDLPEGEEAAVEAAEPYLSAEWAGDAVNFYWKAGRPLRVEVLHGDRATDDVAELVENLPSTSSDGSDGAAGSDGEQRVRAHLRETRSIVYIQMGIDDSNHLGATIGEVLAFHIAEQADGIVRFYDREWAAPADRGVAIWTAT
jgi:hypothetical protein